MHRTQSRDILDARRKSVAAHQRGSRSAEGKQMLHGTRIPRKSSRRRDVEITGPVSLILMTKWTQTLTNEPITVPIATPIAPKRHAR